MDILKPLSRLRAPPYRQLAFQPTLNYRHTWWSKMMASTDTTTPWHAAYPPPRNKTPAAMMRQDVLEMVKDSNNIAGRDYVLVDLRRTDHEVSCHPRESGRAVTNLSSHLGRYDSRVYQSAGTESLPHHTDVV